MANKTAISAERDEKKGGGRTGRPKSSPLEQARRRAQQAKRHFDLAESEYNIRLGDDPSDPERSAEVKAVAELRLKSAAVLNSARKQVSQARAEVKKGTPNALARFDAAKGAERSAWTAFRELPDLGFTPAEWADPDIRKREMGRPQLEIEIRYASTKLAFDEALKALKLEERAEGVKHVPITKLPDPVKLSRGQGLGRPKLDRLGILDRKLTHLDKMIAKIKSEMQAERVVDTSSRRRKAVAPEIKFKNVQDEVDQIRALIESEEAKLNRKGYIQRKLKKLRDERRRMTLDINANPDDCESARQRFDYLSDRINERLAELVVLEETVPSVQKTPEKKQNLNKPDVKKPLVQPDFDLASIAVNPLAVSGAATPGKEQASVHRRRAEAMAMAAEIELRYAQALEQMQLDLEQKIQEERAKIKDIELIS